jgi:hypothetical protein
MPLPRQWTGGAYVLGPRRWLYWSFPFGVLELCGATLALRVVPSFLARLSKVAPERAVQPPEARAILPAELRFHLSAGSSGPNRHWAIGIQRWDKETYFFIPNPTWPLLERWDRRPEILSDIHSAGFPVDFKERRLSVAPPRPFEPSRTPQSEDVSRTEGEA